MTSTRPGWWTRPGNPALHQEVDTVILWHATPAHNLPEIEDRGLDPECSTGRLRVVWLHTRWLSPVLVEVVATRHGVDRDDVRLIAVRVPRRWLRRWRRCLWYCPVLIEPSRLLIPSGTARSPARSPGVEVHAWERPNGR